MRRLLGVLSLLVLLALPAEGQVQRHGSLIYNLIRGRAIEVHIVDADGRHDTPFPAAAGGTDPAFSSDGRQIVFVRVAGDRKAGDRKAPLTSEVCVVPRAGGTPRTLCTVPGYAYGARFTPDMKHVVFCATDASSIPYASIVEATGGNPKLLDSRPVTAVALSPDGRRMACAVMAEKPYIAVKPLRAKGPESRIALAGMAWSLAWSPDSHRLAVVSLEGTTSRLSLMDADGTHRTTLLQPTTGCVGAAFSDDGRAVYTSSVSPEHSALCKMTARKPPVRILTLQGKNPWAVLDGGYGLLMLRAVSTMHTD